uniref:ATP-dependent RNA helicase DDX1 n=1 Tax=Lepeophtheirus salmonis TaxID=72036 RepID=D3PI28_LEPSM|nr:ATP-dependent RNA helicase DDX1 [Lepeophtheirus salmonis]
MLKVNLKHLWLIKKKKIEVDVNLKTGDVIGCYLLLEGDQNGNVKSGRVYWSINGFTVKIKQRYENNYLIIHKSLLDNYFFPICNVGGSQVIAHFDVLPSVDPQGCSIKFTPLQNLHPSQLYSENLHGWKLNVNDSSKNLKFSQDYKTVQSPIDNMWRGVRTTRGVKSHGQFYFEVTVMEPSGKIVVGWTTEEGNVLVGSDKFGFGYGSSYTISNSKSLRKMGKKIHNNAEKDYGKDVLISGDVITCFIDLNLGIVHWMHNGLSFPKAFDLKLCQIDLKQKALYPTIALYNTTVELNFGFKKNVS